MLQRFIPRQENFFRLFRESVDQLFHAAEHFQALINDLQNAERHAQSIAHFEQAGDKITLNTFELLHKTFITPFDRNDIHQLTGKLDDILDTLNRTAQRIYFYRLQTLPGEMHLLANLCSRSSGTIKKIIYQLDSLKNGPEILSRCNELNAIEDEADQLILLAIAHLFERENDFKQFMKLKEVYDYIKQIIDGCQDLGNIVQNIILEYS